MSPAPLTIIVGAGISGLTCAYALQKSGQNVLLLEASECPGGVIRSVEQNGYLYEFGPQSFSSTPTLYKLCDELGLNGELVTAPHGAPRFVLIDNHLTPVPMSPPAFLTSGLLNWNTKFAILSEALRSTSPPEPDESIAAFTRRKFSAQLLERMVGPFVSGIYAGDPEQISLRAAFPKIYEAEKTTGSVVRGMLRIAKTSKTTTKQSSRRPGLISFRAGNESLIKALAQKLGPSLRCNTTVNNIRLTDSGFSLQITDNSGNSQELPCAKLVIATPTNRAASLLQDLAPNARVPLEQIRYARLAVVSLGYRREQITRSLDGFGFLIPRSSGIRTLGTVWNSSLFPNRAPQDHVLLTSFVGGATDPAAAAFPADRLTELVHSELAPILGISGQPTAPLITAYSEAIPQYNLGHTARLQSLRDALSSIPSLRVIGNYWQGPAIGNCIDYALAVAEAVRIS